MPLSDADRARLFRDITEKIGLIRPLEIQQWVRSARDFTRKVAAEGRAVSAEAKALFVIRVCGVIGDLHDYETTQLQALAQMLALGPSEKLQTYQGLLGNFVKSIEKARSAFTKDELLYLVYRRDTECHPFLDAYRLRATKGSSKINETRSIIGSVWTVDEMDLALSSLLRKHLVDETAIAVEFATRLLPAMEEVFQASEAWFTRDP